MGTMPSDYATPQFLREAGHFDSAEEQVLHPSDLLAGGIFGSPLHCRRKVWLERLHYTYTPEGIIGRQTIPVVGNYSHIVYPYVVTMPQAFQLSSRAVN